MEFNKESRYKRVYVAKENTSQRKTSLSVSLLRDEGLSWASLIVGLDFILNW